MIIDISHLTRAQAWDLYCDLYEQLVQDRTPKEVFSILHPTFGHFGWT